MPMRASDSIRVWAVVASPREKTPYSTERTAPASMASCNLMSSGKRSPAKANDALFFENQFVTTQRHILRRVGFPVR